MDAYFYAGIAIGFTAGFFVGLIWAGRLAYEVVKTQYQHKQERLNKVEI